MEIRTQGSSSFIVDEQVGETFHVYNGQKYVPVFIKKEMVGQKLGSFVQTRVSYESKRKKGSKR